MRRQYRLFYKIYNTKWTGDTVRAKHTLIGANEGLKWDGRGRPGQKPKHARHRRIRSEIHHYLMHDALQVLEVNFGAEVRVGRVGRASGDLCAARGANV